MASQRVTLIKVGGVAARIVASKFRQWQADLNHGQLAEEARLAIDAYVEVLRVNAHAPPVVYFAEWIHLWSMGDLLPGLGDARAVTLAGNRFEVCCHQPPVQFQATTIAGAMSQESRWLKQRLAEAEDAWGSLVSESVVIIVREPLGGLVSDEEISASLKTVPNWLPNMPAES